MGRATKRARQAPFACVRKREQALAFGRLPSASVEPEQQSACEILERRRALAAAVMRRISRWLHLTCARDAVVEWSRCSSLAPVRHHNLAERERVEERQKKREREREEWSSF